MLVCPFGRKPPSISLFKLQAYAWGQVAVRPSWVIEIAEVWKRHNIHKVVLGLCLYAWGGMVR